jgi:cupin fold WbuC family metalloprotein
MIGRKEIRFLEVAPAESAGGQVRINLHPSHKDGLHDTSIAISPGSYSRPHRHCGKSEAFHLVHGAVDIVAFDDEVGISDVVQLGALGPGAFHYRLSAPHHEVVARSEILVFSEITEQSDLAAFVPDEGDAVAAQSFAAQSRRRIHAFLAERR